MSIQPSMHIQELFNLMNKQIQRERAESQMTLGKLIKVLEAMPKGALVANLCDPRSYRGYYDDLAFDHEKGKRPAVELLKECKKTVGKVLSGYKGGDYVMDESTPIWIAGYGECGVKLMALYEGGEFETQEDDD